MREHQSLNADLARQLISILNEPSYIYVDSLEPERDRLPVPRGLIAGMAEAFQLANKKISTLEQMTRDLALVLHEILIREPPEVRSNHHVISALNILTKVDELLR